MDAMEAVRKDYPQASEETLLDEMGFDSLELLDFLRNLENECSVTFPYERISEFHTVGDVAKEIGKLQCAHC